MSDSRARIWFALFVLVVFCAGAASGLVIGRHIGPPPPGGPFAFLHGRRGGPGPFGAGFRGDRGGPPPLPPGMLNRLTDELALDAAQRTQVQKILDDRRSRLEEVHREAREKFDREQKDLHEAIRAVLRPDQQQKFDRFLEHRP
jgi:hypothetical protein